MIAIPVIDKTIVASLANLEAITIWINDLFASVDVTKKDDITYMIQLAIHEVCVNIIEHAYSQSSGHIRIAMRIENGLFTAELFDTGKPFNPDNVPAPDLGTAQVRGYGLFLVNELMDRVTYNATMDGNEWYLSKDILD